MSARQTGDIVAIVGGGFTGAAIAYHLASRRSGAQIVVFEPRRFIGGGLPYDTADPAHRINVPASRMSLVPGDDAHFSEWIARRGATFDDGDALGPDGNLYPRRSVFGRYVSEQLRPFLASGAVRHVVDRVTEISRRRQGSAITTSDKRVFFASIVALATTHPPPSVPRVLENAFGNDSRLIRDASAADALRTIEKDDRVLIVGTGLTMADVVASLDRRGHTGQITGLSRRGLLSRGHSRVAMPAFGTFTDRRHTALSLLREIRDYILLATVQGLSWHSVIDAVRAQAQTFWPTLDWSERKRIVRHLRPFWDVHRFRVAPQVEEVLKRREADGSLELIAASLRSAVATDEALLVDYRRRRGGEHERRAFDRVVIATGPAHGAVIAAQPHLAGLAEAGWITADPLGLGLYCNQQGRAIDAAGAVVPSLFVAGPLARGTFGELMGLPQVSDYALAIAEEMLRVSQPLAQEPLLAAGVA